MSRRDKIVYLNKMIDDLEVELSELKDEIGAEREITQDHSTMYMMVNWDHDDDYIH